MSANAYFDMQALSATTISHDPFDHLIVEGFVRAERRAEVQEAYPSVGKPGSFALESLTYSDLFQEFADALRGPDMAQAMGEKFDIDLTNRPTMLTVRDRCRAKDGKIHVDSKGKLVTVLLYMNPAWEADGGRLRLLRSKDDIEDYAAEVPPVEGTLLAFRCTPEAWHGHKSFEGRRQTMQLNWVTDEGYLQRENKRHRISAFFKKFKIGS